MPGRADSTTHAAAIARLNEAAKHVPEIRRHLEEIVNGAAFRGSKRSQEFLKYIVERALRGESEGLRERNIGIDLFSRPAAYDTGEDAIVRVTASDVRKRLLQHYGNAGTESPFRIDLPAGSYIPEFRYASSAASPLASLAATPETLAGITVPGRGWRRPAALAILLLGAFAAGIWLSPRIVNRSTTRGSTPWKELFENGRRTYLVVSDTDIAFLQNLLGTPVALSDYANRQYLSNPDALSPETRRLLEHLVAHDYSATTAVVDLRTALRISEIGHSFSHNLEARSARMIRLQDFKTDDNFILLGSPLSNPWTALFQDHLDFVFEFDRDQKKEVCRNRRPQPGEPALYDPTATMFRTGDAFAIAAFLQNPDQDGHVLILAGSNAEATDGASKFIADPELLSRALKRAGLEGGRAPARGFEVLLRMRTMAGALSNMEVLAVHPLTARGRTANPS